MSRHRDAAAARSAVLEQLQERIGHRFRNPLLLRSAVTHGSALPAGTVRENERLELLGDAVLDLIVTERLLREHPGWDEGRLSKLRARLVQTRSLARLATRLGIEQALQLGRGEIRSGGHAKPSILAAAFEAVLGAVYLDAGIEAARHVVQRAFGAAEGIREVAAQPDWKTAFQEETQRRWRILPEYRVVDREGPDHAPRFTVEVRVEGSAIGSGSASSKRQAEQLAAREALRRLGAAGDEKDEPAEGRHSGPPQPEEPPRDRSR